MTYNPRSVFQSYEQYGRAKTKQAKSSKSKNANQQAARTMGSVGIGGLGGRPTTSSAKQIQDKFRRETQRDSGSTYDEVPQTITTGLGSRKTQTSKDEDMSMGTKIDRAFVKVMTSLIPDFSPPKQQSVFPLQVYGGPLFTVPTPTPVDIQELDAAARDTTRTFAPPSMDAPTLPTTTIDSDVGVTTPKGLMSPPTMTQPKAPEGLMGIPRALAKASAVPTAAYQVQSGDTLSEIAAATGTTVKELADLNQISDVDVIETGADIQIPIKRLEDEAVVTQATSMEDLKPIKIGYRDVDPVDPDAQFYESFRQGVTVEGSEEQRLFDALVQGESVDFDTVYNMAKVKPSKPITQMTVKEVQDWQQANLDAGSKSTAAGRFQIISKNMKYLLDKKIIKKDDVFDANTQMKAYDGLLEKRGYSDFKKDINKATTQKEKQKVAENFLKKLAMEYASVPIPFDIPDRINPETGEGLKKGDSYYEGRSGNTAKNNPKSVEDYLEILKDFSRTGSDI